jgi:hypothetical protein
MAKQKVAAFVLLMAALVVSGGAVGYHFLVRRPIENNAAATAHTEKYGSEADARRVAEDRAKEVEAACWAAVPGGPEALQQIFDLWNKDAAKPSRLPDGCTLGSLEGKLDRESGHWTVSGVCEIVGTDPKAFEIDWKLVVKYTPSTARWSYVDGPRWFAANGEAPTPPRALFAPGGLRPVIKKVGKGSQR